jgi:hypothetical protein
LQGDRGQPPNSGRSRTAPELGASLAPRLPDPPWESVREACGAVGGQRGAPWPQRIQRPRTVGRRTYFAAAVRRRQHLRLFAEPWSSRHRRPVRSTPRRQSLSLSRPPPHDRARWTTRRARADAPARRAAG